jgi:uncharacterized protein DUF3105
MANTSVKETSARGRALTPAKARRMPAWVLVGVAAVVVVAGVVGYLAYRSASAMPGIAMPDQGNLHINLATDPHEPYNSDPPTSGPHLPYIASWGVYNEPIVKELQVHNLEDGGVLVQYNCPSGCPDLVGKLKAIVEKYPEHVILAPYPGMKTRIALTAWTRIDAFDEFDGSRVTRFIKAYQGIDHHQR